MGLESCKACWDQTPPGQGTPLGTRPPWDQAPTPRDQALPSGTRHPLWTESQTPVKTLPCPKLRLRVVNIDSTLKVLRIHLKAFAFAFVVAFALAQCKWTLSFIIGVWWHEYWLQFVEAAFVQHISVPSQCAGADSGWGTRQKRWNSVRTITGRHADMHTNTPHTHKV